MLKPKIAHLFLFPLLIAAAGAVHEMIYKEEQILLPICQERFTENEWAEIWASSPRCGWCPGRFCVGLSADFGLT